MTDGEPGTRTFDTAMPPDPVGWLATFLRERLGDHLAKQGVTGVGDDLAAIAAAAEEIGVAVDDGLAWARAPWPDVEHDERGMAAVR
jgi:hypothetical protein